MTTNKVPLEIHEITWSRVATLIEQELRDLRVVVQGEICRIDIRPGSIRIEAEVLAPDETWEHTNIYERRFRY